MRYKVVRFENGFYGVKDTHKTNKQTFIFGCTFKQAKQQKELYERNRA